MQVHVDSVSDVKTGQYGVSSKIVSGRDHYFVNDDATQYVGKDLEMEISEKTSAKGNKYKIGKILGVIPSAFKEERINGHGIAWQDYAVIARLAHDLAKELEPDHLEQEGENVVVRVDRSAARIALVQTVLVALRDGKIAPLEADDVSPF